MMTVILSAFIYPLGIFMIGLILMHVQPVLYDEVSWRVASTRLISQASLFLFGFYGAKQFILRRPLVFEALIRRLPLFRRLSCAMAAQRFAWVLAQLIQAGAPVYDAVMASAESSGRWSVLRRGDKFRTAILRGAEFQLAFQTFLSAWPKWVQCAPSINSPHYISDWFRPVFDESNAVIAQASHWVKRLSPSVALIFTVPLIFWAMKHQWLAMLAELRERVGTML
jgi:hypothetical protein